jgi:DNA repair protein RAD7
MNAWCTSLPSLTCIELLGPFLVRVEGWKAFFQTHPQLESFLITQSPRFDLECVESLVNNCQDLKSVRLKEIGKLDDTFLGPLKQLKNSLRLLDLAEPGTSLSEESLIDLMTVVGSTLTHLDLSKHDLITDSFLHNGIKPHVRQLASLSLSDIPALTNEGVAKFFETWAEATGDEKPNPPLIFLNLSRNHELSNDALSAILTHSGISLQCLNINSWKTVSEESLKEIAKRAKELRSLDVGWCREIDDFVMKDLIEGCQRLKQVKCWGCNRVSGNCPRKVGVVHA